MKRTLEGIRVLDFCWVGAGALVTKLLAEHGAEVIKVESHARPDNLRVAPPFRPGAEGLDGSGYFASRNNDKKSLTLNMRTPRARELALELASAVDLVTNNFRPGVMESWGLDYETVSARNPGVIYLSMPMQGSSGPHSSFVGFGSTIAALAGLVHLSGLPDRAPIGTGTHYPDHLPSPGHALVAVLAALRQRRHTGVGRQVELSQFEATVSLLAPTISAAARGTAAPERRGNRADSYSPSGVFPCAGEDAWCALAARNDEEWRALCKTLEAPALADDLRFATVEARRLNEDGLERELASLTETRDRNELALALQKAGVPAYAVLSSRDVLADRQLEHRKFWRRIDHPVMGAITAASAPFTFDGERVGPERAAPLLGEHTREIARHLLRLDDAEIDSLVAEEVLW